MLQITHLKHHQVASKPGLLISPYEIRQKLGKKGSLTRRDRCLDKCFPVRMGFPVNSSLEEAKFFALGRRCGGDNSSPGESEVDVDSSIDSRVELVLFG